MRDFEYKPLFPGARVDADGGYRSPNVCYATEGPLIHDGSQTTASADYSGTTTTLSGQNGSGQFLAVSITANRQVTLVTTKGGFMYGVLQNKPASGQAADVGIEGVTKMMAGASISAGAYVTPTTTGAFVTAATTDARVAVAIETAGAAGVIFTGAIVPAALARDTA
jgi:hypothetical protein